MENDSVWLTQAQIAHLFGVDRTVIVRHVLIIHLPTGKKFHNRKEAKIYFDTAYYYKMAQRRELSLIHISIMMFSV